MKKDTRFSIRKLTVGVASIAVASFLTSGSVDAADLSILNSHIDDDVYNPELPFEPFPPSISYTQPEAPWMVGTVDAEDPEVEVPVVDNGEVSEPLPSEPLKSNGKNPLEPFAPVKEKEEAENPEPETEPETEEDLGFEILPGYKVEEVEGADGKIYKRLVVDEDYKVEEDVEEEVTPEPEEDLGFEILPGYKVEEVEGADGKIYKRLVPIEDDEVEEETTEEETTEEETTEEENTTEGYASREEAEAAALAALADDEINNAYEITEIGGKFYYQLLIKEPTGVDLTELTEAEVLDTRVIYPAPSQETKEIVTNSFAGILAEVEKKGANLALVQNLLKAGLNAYKLVTENEEATLTDALAAGLEYYRVVSKNESAKLEDVLAELEEIEKLKDPVFAYSLNGARALDSKYSDSNSPIENYKKAMGVEVPNYTEKELDEVKEMAENGNENAKEILGLLGL